jgi:hypothetical protein
MPDRPGALEKIRQLEAAKGQLPAEVADKQFGLPVIVEHLNDVSCTENDVVKFKCKVEPKDDPNLQIGNFCDFVVLNHHESKDLCQNESNAKHRMYM